MSTVFKNQSLLTIKLETSYNLSTATTTEILYEKPGGSTGKFEAEIEDNTVLTYNVKADDIDLAGIWQFQAHAVIGSLHTFGEKVELKFEEIIEVSE